MGTITKLLVLIIGILLLFGGIYVYSLSKIEVRSINLNNIGDISLSGFTLNGHVDVYNGGLIPVGIDHVQYDVILEKTGDRLASGYIQGTIISPGTTVQLPITNKIDWTPTVEMAVDLLNQGDTYIKVSGNVYVANLQIIEFKIPFQQRINIEQYIRQFIVSTVQQVVDTGVKIIAGVGKAIVDVANQVFGDSNQQNQQEASVPAHAEQTPLSYEQNAVFSTDEAFPNKIIESIIIKNIDTRDGYFCIGLDMIGNNACNENKNNGVYISAGSSYTFVIGNFYEGNNPYAYAIYTAKPTYTASQIYRPTYIVTTPKPIVATLTYTPSFVTMKSGQGYNFSAGTFGGTEWGDFYYYYQDGLSKFWANNMMNGLQDVGTYNDLNNVLIPSSGYYKYGVLSVAGHTYVAIAKNGKSYIIFNVNFVNQNQVDIMFIIK